MPHFQCARSDTTFTPEHAGSSAYRARPAAPMLGEKSLVVVRARCVRPAADRPSAAARCNTWLNPLDTKMILQHQILITVTAACGAPPAARHAGVQSGARRAARWLPHASKLERKHGGHGETRLAYGLRSDELIRTWGSTAANWRREALPRLYFIRHPIPESGVPRAPEAASHNGQNPSKTAAGEGFKTGRVRERDAHQLSMIATSLADKFIHSSSSSSLYLQLSRQKKKGAVISSSSS